MADEIEAVVTPEVEPVAKVEPTPEAKPGIDVDNIRKQANYFAKHPEAAEVFLENYDTLTGGKLAAEVKDLRLAFVTEQVMRKCNLDDDDRDLIEAPTAAGILAKGLKLQAKKQAAVANEEEGKPKPPTEIVYPQHKFEPKNDMEAAYSVLRQFK